MPSKGCTLKNGKRHNIVNRSFVNALTRDLGLNLNYNEVVAIINASNEAISDSIINNVSGFKLPMYLGYVVVSRYKPKSGMRYIDFKKSKEAGVIVYHTNFHSFGYQGRIQWLTAQLSTCKNIGIYKFVAERKLSRAVSAKLQEGKVYNETGFDQFRSRRIRLNIDKLIK